MARKGNAQIWVEYLFAHSIWAVVGWLPGSAAIGFGRSVAWLGYRLFGKLRRVGHRSLAIACPDKPEAEREQILKDSFASLGRTLGVVGGFGRVTQANIRDLIELELDAEFTKRFEKARAEKRGMIVLTGHIGNWELFALAFSMFFGPANLLSRKMDNPKIDAMVERMRSSFGNRQIDKTNAAAPILKALRNGECVGILADVNTHPKEGVFVPFFGVDACTTAGVAMLALRANALIVPMFAVWDKTAGRYKMINEPIIEPQETGDRKADILRITAEFTAAIERVVRKYPEQWIWIHRRWKTRPPGDAELYDNI